MYFSKPDIYLKPSYLISPFNTNFIAFNNALPEDNYCVEYLNYRFGKDNWILTQSGREAIKLVYKNLDNIDKTVILTTSNNRYISSCVTDTISVFGNWSRVYNDCNKITFINHEFGFCFEPTDQIKSDILIEDYCTSFFLNTGVELEKNNWRIFSFPKFFPIQIGGILVGKDIKNHSKIKSQITEEECNYILKTISFHLKNEEIIMKRRLWNYSFLNDKMNEIGFESKFKIREGNIPYVFLFKCNNGAQINWDELKLHFYSYGIQCSVFYGDESFFIPVHQELNEIDLQYFTFVMRDFLNKY